MILTLCLCFTALLLLGMPISVMLMVTTALGLALFTNTPLTILVQQLFNALDNSVLMSIPFFMLAGAIMTEGAMARRLIAVMQLLVGRFRGGSALAAVVACLFFAAISGSSPATVAAIGSIMFPALLKAGYPKDFTLGLITSAGSLGIVIPPSIPMILYCMVMNVSVAKLFMAGFVPGFIIAGVFMTYTWVLARKRNWRSNRRYTAAETRTILTEGIWGLLLPVIVLGGIYAGMFTPTEAAAVSVLYALAVETLIHREITWARLYRVCRDSAILSSCLLFILACAMTFVWLLTAEQIPVAVADWMIGLVDSWWMFLLLVALLFLLMGMVMDDVSAMLILAPIFTETLARYDIDLVHFGIVMVLLIEYGFLTPPFGLNLFVTMGITGESLTIVGRAVGPFLFWLLLCVLLITFVPQISLFLPNLLLPALR
jgi:C4-dicarboxylate transporter DctM subunit